MRQCDELEMKGKCMSSNKLGPRFTTPIGRLSYPFVFERARPLEAGKEGKYEVTLYIPKSEDITELKAAMEAVGKEAFGPKWKGIGALKHPVIKDGDQAEAGHASNGHWVIRAKSAKRPLVVDSSRAVIDDKDQIYGGCWGRLNVTPASFAIPTGWGVTMYLNAVQKVKDGERFGGADLSAEQAFEALADATSAEQDF